MSLWERMVKSWRRSPVPERPEHLTKGERAERIAAEWMRKELRIRWRHFNWRHGKGEIDLIGVLPGGQWVFVEVRSRQAGALVSGYHSITRDKKTLLRHTVAAYLRLLPVTPPWRFDVVDIAWLADGRHELRHFEEVSLGPWKRRR